MSEEKCEHCKKPYTIDANGRPRRCKAKNMKVCYACYRRYKRRGTFEYYKPQTKEEIKQKNRKRINHQNNITKIITKDLKQISVDELLHRVGYYDDDE